VELISPLTGDARADAATELGSPVERMEIENALAVSGIGRLPEISAGAPNYLRHGETSNSS
jgi:hypothetical protein